MAYKRDVRDFRQSVNARGKKTRNPGYKPGDHWVQCDRCASIIRSSDAMFTWDKLIVCPDDWEIRHPQDFVRGRADDIAAKEPRRSESQDVFLETCGSSGVVGIAVVGCAKVGFLLCSTSSAVSGIFIAGCAISGFPFDSLEIQLGTFINSL